MSTRAFTGLGSVYEEYRPRYPAQAIDWLYAQRAFRPGEILLDVACGTGILTRALLRPGLRVVGLEPNADMRAHAHGIEVLEGVAERLPFADRELAAITCGQALHWLDRPAFFAECLRALQPDGFLAVLDNNRDPDDALMQAYEGALERLSEGTYRRDYRTMDHRSEMLAADFARYVHRSFRWQRAMTPQAFLALASSSSKVQGVAARAGAERLWAEISSLVQGPTVVVPYVTEVRLACPKGSK